MNRRRLRAWVCVIAASSVVAAAAAACDEDPVSSGSPAPPEAGAFDAPAVDAPAPDGSPPVDAGADVQDAAVDATYLYVSDYVAGKVFGFAVNAATGALTSVPGSPFTTSANTWMIHARDGVPALFAPSEGTTLHAYAIDPATGSLTAAPGSPYPLARTGTYGATTDPSGRYLYLNAPNQADTVAAYRIDPSTRALGELDASPFPGVLGSLATNAMHPQGKYLYVVSAEHDAIHVLALDAATGATAEVPGSPFLTGPPGGGFLNNPQVAISDHAGKHLYVANYAAANVVIFDIAPDGGALSYDAGTTADAGPGSCGFALDPAGKLLYVGASLGVHGFLVDPTTGRLTPASGSPLATEDYLCGLAFSPDGRFLFGAQSAPADAGAVVVYEVNQTTGALTPKPSFTKAITSNQPGHMAITTLRKAVGP